jgi:acylphosphatase
MKHFNLHISGKVQGVFFRASTKTKADELNIKGIVKNQRDGSVYVEAEGEDKTLNEFIDWCKTGPKHAAVESVKIEEGKPKQFSTFEIVR